ncbi:HIRAN domain-containing protein [Shinella daejeonensis]|uniref:HIRAN domain-containing protein n=1 Tax=Shinella daejeonensis TaxID=659017 RepID=UPI0020C74D45|nr:HIRAN domain-containing protein [Shinella daejeonensis]MCP8896372.1 HIRAN domain-containing protein [Shinella daejeonensis]
MHKQYHLDEYPIPDGFRIYRDRVPVMGVTMRKADAAAFCKGSGKQVAFEREPNNRHDPNAIRIMGSWKGWFSRKEKMLGYVPAEDAVKLVRLGLADSVRPRLMKTYLGTDGFVEIEIQIIGPKHLYPTFNPPPPPKVVSPAESSADDAAALARLDTLTTFLKGEAIVTPQQLEKLRKAQSRKTVSRMMETGETYGQASGAPAFLNQPEGDFRAHLQSIDNDLSAQLDIVDKACRSYFETGEVPAPYYPWRIAVILSKAKMRDREREFLAAWCRHFAEGRGKRYGELVERANKLNATVGGPGVAFKR